MSVVDFPKKSTSDAVLIDCKAAYELNVGDDITAVLNIITALQESLNDVVLSLSRDIVQGHPDHLLPVLVDRFAEALEDNLDPEDIRRVPPNFIFDDEPPRAS